MEEQLAVRKICSNLELTANRVLHLLGIARWLPFHLRSRYACNLLLQRLDPTHQLLAKVVKLLVNLSTAHASLKSPHERYCASSVTPIL